MMSLLEYILERRNKTEEEQTAIEGMSALDKFNKADEREKEKMLIQQFENVIKQNGPTIYAFVVKQIQRCIKIGYTDQHPAKRIQQWKDVYEKPHGYELIPIGIWPADVFDEAANKRLFFWDHAVHQKVINKKYLRVERDEFYKRIDDNSKKDLTTVHYSKEFFNNFKKPLQGETSPEENAELSEELIGAIIDEMRKNILEHINDPNYELSFPVYNYDTKEKAEDVWGAPDNYNNTSLQNEAIKNGINAIKRGKKNMLMAAVMRFGKTHAAYEIVKGANIKNVLVTSAKAETRKAWKEDINHEHFYKDFIFIEIFRDDKWKITAYDEKRNTLVTGEYNVYDNMLEDKWPGKTRIFYFTLHDLAGSLNEIKKKHEGVIDQEFDMLIVDETHYGSHANKFGKMTVLGQEYVDDEYEDEVADMQEEAEELKQSMEDINTLRGSNGLKYKCILQVSGTPYYILASNEMLEDDSEIISKVSYTDMLKARDKWEEDNLAKDDDEKEEPWESPYYGMPTLHKIGMKLTSGCRKVLANKKISGDISALFQLENSKFKYEKEITDLMKSLFGDGSNDKMSFLENKKVKGSKTCKHTMIVLPRIAACEAMKKLLKKFINENKRKIINLTGSNPDAVVAGDDKNGKPVLDKYLQELDTKEIKTIILTVNKALTGVSIKALDSMIYLKNARSPQEYDQNIFRLCTRYVRKVTNKDGTDTRFINMKDNVYLIDFNIANMFNMLANSARMKAAAEGNPTVDRIKELMDEDLKSVPVFCEDGVRNEITAKMDKITSKDLMKIYSGYNKNKSIADIAGDDVDLFVKLFDKPAFQRKMNSMFKEGDSSKINIGQPDDENANIDVTGLPDAEKKDKKMKHLSDKARDITANELKKQAEEARKKFKRLVKMLLYWNLCQDEPYQDMTSIMKAVEENVDLEKEFNSFGIKYDNLVELYKGMGTNFKMAFDQILTKINILAQDKTRGSNEKFLKALEGLGRIDKSEVITPEAVVEKMINKIPDEEYRKAETILLVNEKSAEFFRGLCKKFNNSKKIIEKCRIVPSSEIGIMFVKKMLKTMGLIEYINTIILDIGDVNDDGEYNVKDFLALMKNKEELEKKTGVKKFDICLMNPPYLGDSRNDYNFPLKFLNKVCEITDKIVSIQPIMYLYKTYERKHPEQAEKTAINNAETYKYEVEEITNKEFDAAIGNKIGIIYCDTTKNSDIIIVNGKQYNTVSEINNFSSDSLLVEFNNIVRPLYKHDSVIKHWTVIDKRNEKTGKDLRRINDSKLKTPFVKVAALRGNKGTDDMYSILPRTRTFEHGERPYTYINFETETEANGFINYVKTDFCCIILYMYKNDMMLGPHLHYIPWFDFSQDIFSKSPREIDDYLFKKYNISDEIRKHIEEILPDYYEIRK